MTISTQLTATTDTEANRRMSGEDMRHVFMSSLQSDDTEPSRKKVPPTHPLSELTNILYLLALVILPPVLIG